MNWQIYELRFRIETPIHIGFHKLRFIERTRFYVPGRTMWGAAAEAWAKSNGSGDYTGAQNLFQTTAILSYFYLSKEERIFLPRYTPEGLMIGDMPAGDFEAKYLTAITKTAIEPVNLAAEEASLHETEFIKADPELALVGYLFLKNGRVEIDKLKETLSSLSIGGERRYGFGKIRYLADWKEMKIADKDKTIELFGIKVKVAADGDFDFPANEPIFAHLDANGTESIKIKGAIEPLVGREWGKDKERVGYGQHITEARICWVPGSIIEEECTLKLGEFGILNSAGRGDNNG